MPGVLSRDRAVIENERLTVISGWVSDSGTYMCTAANELGSTSAGTTLVVSPGKLKWSTELESLFHALQRHI